MNQKPNIIAKFSHLSSREVEGAGPTTLSITTWDDGSVVFDWSVEQKSLATVEFCINAFFALLTGIPKIFGKLGQPVFFGSCDMPTVLACFHDETFPEIGMGVLNDGEKTPISIVTLDRGTLLTELDKIGHLLATLEDVSGCADSEDDEDEEEEVVAEADTSDDDKDDPFSGINTSVRH